MTENERIILQRPLGPTLLLQLAAKGRDVSRHAIRAALELTGDVPRLSPAEIVLRERR